MRSERSKRKPKLSSWRKYCFRVGRALLLAGPEQSLFSVLGTWLAEHRPSTIDHRTREGPKMGVTIVGIDLAKNVFRLHCCDGQGPTSRRTSAYCSCRNRHCPKTASTVRSH